MVFCVANVCVTMSWDSMQAFYKANMSGKFVGNEKTQGTPSGKDV